MEAGTTRLTPLLHELEALMAAAGASLSARALPGLTDKEIDALLAPTGLAVPTELREWWRWHHGFRIDEAAPLAHRIEPGAWGPMSIPQAVDDAALWFESGASELGWRRTWLPFAEAPFHQRRLVARLEDSTADEVCVGHWYVFDIPPNEPLERCLADVVQTWIRAIHEGYATWADGVYVSVDPRPDFPPYAWP